VPEPRTVVYSFRRCPYAIRARLALAVAGVRPGIDLDLREVSLRAKPPELLAVSPAATVPVLVESPPPAGGGWRAGAGPARVLDQSLAIMHWALEHQDPQGWLRGWGAAERAVIGELIAQNDGPFKHHLDRFKYAGRHGPAGLAAQGEHRQAALGLLRGWSRRLERGGWLLGGRCCLADWALLPFVRQFRLADPQGFDAEPGLEPLQRWLARLLAGPELAAVMAEPWATRAVWRSPGWLYHLALRQEWQQARAEGSYRRSTRGQSLEQVGFIHLSAAHQLPATAARFFGDLPATALVLLVIDPARLAAAGGELRWEPVSSGERFPHLLGPLPLSAVLLAGPWSHAIGHCEGA
jgi:glutathione S-transferase